MSLQTMPSVVSENIEIAKIQVGAESVFRPTSGESSPAHCSWETRARLSA